MTDGGAMVGFGFGLRHAVVVALAASLGFLPAAQAVPLVAQKLANCGGDKSPIAQTGVSPGHPTKYRYDGAMLTIGPAAVSKARTVGIAPLNQDELESLDTGLFNVTLGPRCGYRFTPEHMHFK